MAESGVKHQTNHQSLSCLGSLLYFLPNTLFGFQFFANYERTW